MKNRKKTISKSSSARNMERNDRVAQCRRTYGGARHLLWLTSHFKVTRTSTEGNSSVVLDTSRRRLETHSVFIVRTLQRDGAQIPLSRVHRFLQAAGSTWPDGELGEPLVERAYK